MDLSLGAHDFWERAASAALPHAYMGQLRTGCTGAHHPSLRQGETLCSNAAHSTAWHGVLSAHSWGQSWQRLPRQAVEPPLGMVLANLLRLTCSEQGCWTRGSPEVPAASASAQACPCPSCPGPQSAQSPLGLGRSRPPLQTPAVPQVRLRCGDVMAAGEQEILTPSNPAAPPLLIG